MTFSLQGVGTLPDLMETMALLPEYGVKNSEWLSMVD